MTGRSDPGAATRVTYDAIAAEYERRTRVGFDGLADELDAFCAVLPERALVADVGCGPGRDTALLRSRGLRIVGLDLSMGMLRAGGLAGVARADMRALPLADQSLDGVWCHAAMLHVPLIDVPTVLAEFARVVRRSGVLHLIVAEGDGEGWQASDYDGQPPRWFSHHREESLRALLDRVGYEVDQVSRRRSHRAWLTVLARRR